MAKTIEEWLDTDVAELEKLSLVELGNTFFFRDPMRPTFIDNEHFYSPADGVILYQKIVEDPTKPMVEVKGMNYSLQELMGDKRYNKPSLVIGIFMSFYDVHINRIPYTGVLQYEQLDSIESSNKPMLAVEKNLLNGVINPKHVIPYIKNNERMWNKVYSPSLDYSYYMVQIADEDVDVIVPFTTEQNELFTQKSRFSLIRWGSQTDLVLPLDDRFDFELCLPEHMHVEGGLDKLVKIKFKD